MAAPGISDLFCAVIGAISEWLPRSISLQLPPPLPPAPDIEMAVEEDDANQEPPFPSFVERIKSPLAQSDLNWSKLVVAFCFGSAIEIAHQSQSRPQHLSTVYLLLCCAISVSFSCIFVAKFIGSRFSTAEQVMEHVGVLFAVTAFFLAITSPFPVSLKCTVWAFYAVSLLAILISNLFIIMPSIYNKEEKR